jgi:diguanylate cyclase (GGDEF)-like protein
MPRIHFHETVPVPQASALREALTAWGFEVLEGPGEGTVLLVAERPEVGLLPAQGRDLLWWVREATPEEVSAVLTLRPGWVVRQDRPLESVREALGHLRTRDFGPEGWLRRMLHLATLDELLRLILVRALELSGATQGAIWVRVGDMFYQRAGEGFAEAPIPRAEAAVLIRQGDAWALCPREQVGLLRLKNPTGDPDQFLGWTREVESLLINAWSLERSQELSFKDDLTVAQNRRCLEVELPRAIRDAAARQDCLSLLFLDVDDLKALNSLHGHPTGSRVLTTVAQEALRLIRAQDRIYRYGGDEFCIVIRGTAAVGASKLGARLIRMLMERPMAIGPLHVPISISIGIATYPTHADGAEHLMERADRALFRAKAEGKGRVSIAE